MEGAVRVFAGEYNASTLQVRRKGEEESPFVVTPGGAWCRGMYLAGALTEIAENGDMLRCRIADPTGAFELVTGGRKTVLADMIRNLPIPSFVTVLGQARMFKKGAMFMLSVRPDEVRVVDRRIRDQWVLSTAESMIGRLEAMNRVLVDQTGDERYLVASRHYAMTPSGLSDLGQMIDDAVNSIRPPASATPEPGNAEVREMVFCIVKDASGPRGIGIEEVIVQAGSRGIAKDTVLSTLESLIVEDECYQPQKGFVKAL